MLVDMLSIQNLCEAVDADTFKIPKERIKIKSFILQTNTAEVKTLNNETISYLFQTFRDEKNISLIILTFLSIYSSF